jgi:hypothetical protein
MLGNLIHALDSSSELRRGETKSSWGPFLVTWWILYSIICLLIVLSGLNPMDIGYTCCNNLRVVIVCPKFQSPLTWFCMTHSQKPVLPSSLTCYLGVNDSYVPSDVGGGITCTFLILWMGVFDRSRAAEGSCFLTEIPAVSRTSESEMPVWFRNQFLFVVSF